MQEQPETNSGSVSERSLGAITKHLEWTFCWSDLNTKNKPFYLQEWKKQ